MDFVQASECVPTVRHRSARIRRADAACRRLELPSIKGIKGGV